MAERALLVMENLDTHDLSSPARRWRGLAARLEIYHPPDHGKRLNVAEIEQSSLVRQVPGQRGPNLASLRAITTGGAERRKQRDNSVDRQFTAAEA